MSSSPQITFELCTYMVYMGQTTPFIGKLPLQLSPISHNSSGVSFTPRIFLSAANSSYQFQVFKMTWPVPKTAFVASCDWGTLDTELVLASLVTSAEPRTCPHQSVVRIASSPHECHFLIGTTVLESDAFLNLTTASLIC